MKTGVIIQARQSSTRLPHKITMKMPSTDNISMLGRVILRAKKAVPDVIVATSQLPDDDITKVEAEKYGAKVYRGSLDDVLERYIKAAEEYEIERIVRITADCPCIDPEIISRGVKLHISSGVDYVSNVEERSFPHGLDTEIVTLAALKKTDMEEKDIRVREHVTWHIRQSDNYRKLNFKADEGSYENIRITVDTSEDYALINLIYYMLGSDFGYRDIINLFEKNSWLYSLNNNIYQKYVFTSREEELKEAVKLLTINGFKKAVKIIEKNI